MTPNRRDDERRPLGKGGARQQRTIQQIIYRMDTFCTSGAVVSQLVATWARSRNDALAGKLATDAYRIVVDAPTLNERLVAVLEGSGEP